MFPLQARNTSIYSSFSSERTPNEDEMIKFIDEKKIIPTHLLN